MLKENMYVRFPSDFEDDKNPRIFICGQIMSINRFSETADIRVYDPFQNLQFFPNLKGKMVTELLVNLEHCTFFDGTRVIHGGNECSVVSSKAQKNDYTYYYVQNIKTKKIEYVCETLLEASFNNGKVSPVKQLLNYEFQNPAWYLCRSIVSKNLNVLDNSIVGFKDLAGCKIFLLPHQVNTIMRCLQDDQCRYMLADEVGMGKTIEALSIYKLFIKNQYRAKSLILVPDSLLEQWKIEMFLKFNILPGEDSSNNKLVLKSPTQLNNKDLSETWDFLIVDEVHNYLKSEHYGQVHQLSKNAKNVLLLSATPVQQREKEYLDLLRLLSPGKYDEMPLNSFNSLIAKQKRIVQQTTIMLGDLEDYIDEIESTLDDGDLPEDSEDCKDIFDEIIEEIEKISEVIDDDNLNHLISQINFEDDDYGVENIKTTLAYISSNFQVENSIIRNRRKLLEAEDDDKQLPIRHLLEIEYDLDPDLNSYESNVYNQLIVWLENNKSSLKNYANKYVKSLLTSFFSSVWALKSVLRELRIDDPILLKEVAGWYEEEKYICHNINDVLDDPDSYPVQCNSRIVKLMNYLIEEILDQKVVLFTDYLDTFEVYKQTLITVFGNEAICTFSKVQNKDENEVNVYKFQNDKNALFLLCDSSGGEGRNFQIADYVVHIDLPWNANTIEQRIGRLDRLERDSQRPIVNSVVVHTTNTFENELFNYWNNGLNIFKKSLSGMEIIMSDINNEIIKAVDDDIQYQLAYRIPGIIKLSEGLVEEINKERDFDAASIMYRPMFIELRKLITYYAENENSLFTRAMNSWASMAGFNGTTRNGIISFSPNKFSVRSAEKSLLMPPKFAEYIVSGQNQFITKVTNMYNSDIKKNDRSIRGTFERKKAIENDYLHFFAPGDAIFDCIVDNAMNTCKGQASAFAFQSKYSWKGFVFTFKLNPDLISVLQKNKSYYLLNSYRTYLCNELISIPVSIENYDSISNGEILREFNSFLNQRTARNDTVSFGKRSKSSKFLSDVIVNDINIEWFKKYYNKEIWSDMVMNAYKEALERVKVEYQSKSNIRGAKEEMLRQISTRRSNLKYYDVTDNSVESMKKEFIVVIDALKNAKIKIDSACFVWMVK